MYDQYAATITGDAVADTEFAAEVTSHIAAASGPVHVVAAHGTGKVNAIRTAASAAGYTSLIADTWTLNPGDSGYVPTRLEQATGDVVLIVDRPLIAPFIDPELLRRIAEHPRVRATFVVDRPTH